MAMCDGRSQEVGRGETCMGSGRKPAWQRAPKAGPEGPEAGSGVWAPAVLSHPGPVHPSKGDAGRSTAEGAERMHDAGSEAKELTLEEAGPAEAMK